MKYVKNKTTMSGVRKKGQAWAITTGFSPMLEALSNSNIKKIRWEVRT